MGYRSLSVLGAQKAFEKPGSGAAFFSGESQLLRVGGSPVHWGCDYYWSPMTRVYMRDKNVSYCLRLPCKQLQNCLQIQYIPNRRPYKSAWWMLGVYHNKSVCIWPPSGTPDPAVWEGTGLFLPSGCKDLNIIICKCLNTIESNWIAEG